MLNGFAVPHAHFRVFQGNATAESNGKGSGDQIPLLFHPAGGESVPTDLHLREFPQLDAQIKSLLQQFKQQHHAGASWLMDLAQAASLAECLSFYTRLMTPESFAWPDFLTTVVVKLTAHFVAIDNDLVRKTILDVFRGSRAHVALVVDASKVVGFVHGLLRQESSKLWALRLVETLPSLVKNDPSVRESLLSSITAMDENERAAAIHATRAVLPHCRVLRAAVWKQAMQASDPMLVTLLPIALEDDDGHNAERAWNVCASLFHEQVCDQDALLCIQAAGQIAFKFGGALLSLHLQLVRFIVSNDPRALVATNAWSSIHDCAAKLDETAVRATFMEVVLLQFQSTGSVAAKVNALLSVSRYCAVQGDAPVEIVNAAREFVSSHPQFKSIFVQLLAHNSRWELSHNATLQGKESGPQELAYLKELIQYLAPTHFVRRQKLWLSALESVKTLTSVYPDLISDLVGQCHVQLLHSARRKKLEPLEAALWLSLSRMIHYCPSVLVDNASELISDAAMSALDSKTKQAIAVCIIQCSTVWASREDKDVWETQCVRLITTASPSDRYDVARVAMCSGASQLALQLLEPIANEVDHESFGSWLQALVAINEAEALVQSSRIVSMNAHHRLITGNALLEAVVSAKYGFDFQVSFVQARAKWMDLMLRAQQYAAEITHTGRRGGDRERRLSEAFFANAEDFGAIRSKMLCASPVDQEVLDYHAQLSVQLGSATLKLLVQDPSKPRAVENIPSCRRTSAISPRFGTLSALAVDVENKALRLQDVEVSRRPVIGATVFVQLLQGLCTLPPLMPRLFFRSQSRPDNAVRCNVQFLTHAEATAYTSKPRPRSQLGVAQGTDFTSTLHGSVVFPKRSTVRSDAKHLMISITLVCDKPEAGTVVEDRLVRETVVRLPNDTVLASGDWLYAPVEVPIHVACELLKIKGTYTVHANVGLIDSNGETWQIAATGGRRNIIVY